MTTFLFLQLEGLAALSYFLGKFLYVESIILSVLVTVELSAPLFYGTACTLHWAYTNRRFGQDLIRRFRARGYAALDNHDDVDDDDGRHSDRIENPDRYHRQNLAHFTKNM